MDLKTWVYIFNYEIHGPKLGGIFLRSGGLPGVGILPLYEFTPLRKELEFESPRTELMADYKYLHYLSRAADPRFDPAHAPGTTAPQSGIYKCQGCGCETVRNAGDSLPTEEDHQHPDQLEVIAWRLIVAIA